MFLRTLRNALRLAGITRSRRRKRKAYRGRIDVARLPEIVAELRRRNQAVTTSAISVAFGLERTAFHHAMRKHPELKSAYEKAVAETH